MGLACSMLLTHLSSRIRFMREEGRVRSIILLVATVRSPWDTARRLWFVRIQALVKLKRNHVYLQELTHFPQLSGWARTTLRWHPLRGSLVKERWFTGKNINKLLFKSLKGIIFLKLSKKKLSSKKLRINASNKWKCRKLLYDYVDESVVNYWKKKRW